jgi:hypothetical protein
MSLYFRLTCGECDEIVVYRKDKYVHYNQGVKHLHEVTEVLSERIEE